VRRPPIGKSNIGTKPPLISDASPQVGPKTAFNAWTLWTTACKAACGQWAKDKDGIQFKVREDNIAANVHPPDRNDPKQLQFLDPDEFLALVSCEQVPLDWRRIYALAIYLVPRASELRALTWDSIDLAHGAISIRQAFDQERGEVKQTKTGNKGIRRFAIEPEWRGYRHAVPTVASQPAWPKNVAYNPYDDSAVWTGLRTIQHKCL
jgi:integrase